MAYVPFPESGTKRPQNDPALKRQCRQCSNFQKAKATAFLKCLYCLEGLLLGVVIERKTLSSYNIFKENGHAKCQVSI